MPVERRRCLWGDLATLEYGKGLRGYQDGSGQFPVYGTNGLIGRHSEPLCKHPGVIIGRKGVYRGVHYSKEPFFVIDTAFYLEPKADIDLRWAYYELLTQDINGLDSGSAIPSTSRESFYALPVLVPPLPEQRAIAGILGALDDKIELNRRMNETLEAMARAIFKSWFVDFDPVRAKAEGRRPYGMDEETTALFPNGLESSSVGETPIGWPVVQLGRICDVTIGGDWGADSTFLAAIEVQSLRGVDLERTRSEGWCEAPRRWLKPASLSKRTMSESDVLIAASGVGPLGRTLWMHPAVFEVFDVPLTYSNFCKRLKTPGASVAAFVEMHLHRLRESGAIWEYSTGTALPNLDTPGLLGHEIVLPPGSLLERFHSLVSSTRAKLHSRENRLLGELRDTLLPKLMSGELRVKDAGASVAEVPT